MMTVLLALTTVNIVRSQRDCHDGQECSPNQYCYDVSSICVNYTQCGLHNRHEGEKPARQPSECGDCLPGYEAETLVTGKIQPLCMQKMDLKEPEKEPGNNDMSTGVYIAIGVVFVLFLVVSITVGVNKMTKCTIFEASASGRFFEKVRFLAPRPTAPPQDDALNQLRGTSYPEEEQPPMYCSVVGPSVAKEHLVSTTPDTPPSWVTKPPYEPADYNHNVADGVAIPVHNSTTNLQMELDEEAETNPSSWTPEQVTVNVPARPFALFASSEQHDNVLNNVLIRGNYSSNSHDGSGSDDTSEGTEEASGSRARGGAAGGTYYSGPNVQVNQMMLTLNIANNGTK